MVHPFPAFLTQLSSHPFCKEAAIATTTTALLLSLLAWLGTHTGYAVPSSEKELPAVTFRTAHELRVLYFGSEKMASENSSRNIRALYDKRKNQMLLNAELNPENPEYRAVVLHELVHFLQAFNGKTYQCLAQSEMEAYKLTNEWITDTKTPVPLYDLLYAKALEMECYFPSTP